MAIDVEDDGTVHIASPDGIMAQKAIDIIKGLTTEPEVGEFYMGVVRRIAEFGAFVEILPGTDGLVHISELDEKRVRPGARHLQGGRRDGGQGDRHRPRHGQDPAVPARGHGQDAGRGPQLPHRRRRRLSLTGPPVCVVTVRFKRLRPGAVLPRYMTAGAAGMDLASAADGPLTLQPGERIGVPTGLAMELPPGHEGQVRPRSGLASRTG